MAPKPPPSRRNVDPEVTFNWPGQQRRPREPGVLDVRLAARRERQQAANEAASAASGSAPAEPPGQAPPKSQPPARRADVTASNAREKWIVTELRRQAVSTDAALRDVSERIDQVSRT